MHRRVLAIAIALVVSACGGSAPSAAPSGPVPSALPAGTYTSTAFKPATTFTVPAGWELAADSGTYLQLRPLGSQVLGLNLFRDAQAPSQDPTCPIKAEPGVGRTTTQLLAWMRTLKGLTVGSPSLITVGGLPGVSVEIGIAPDWTQSCPFAGGLPTVPLLMAADIDRWVIFGDERLRLYLVDLPSGGTLIVDVDASDGSLAQFLTAATPIVRSLQFGAG